MRLSARVNVLLFPLIFVLIFALPMMAQTSAPRVFLVDATTLAAQKAHPNPELLGLVKSDADKAMKTPPLTVTSKSKVPPSGDKHDYMGMARYFWPNPDTKDHLPYVRHDGKTNPEIHDIKDGDDLERMSKSSRSLALGYYLTGDERYAEHAAMLMRTWFLAPETAMRPNMNFSQYVPGVNSGRGAGILDARYLDFTIDAAGMMQGSKSWTSADDAGLKQWFSEYYAWLSTNKEAKHEDEAPNNHGSWFAMQKAPIAMFLGKTDDAKAIGEFVRDKRIPSQIDAVGAEKYELARTNSFSYSAFNLEALTQLAITVAPLGVDLYKTMPGILTALDALLPYDAQHPWPHDQIVKGKESSLCPALVRAAAYTHQAKYAEAEKRFDCEHTAESVLVTLSK